MTLYKNTPDVSSFAGVRQRDVDAFEKAPGPLPEKKRVVRRKPATICAQTRRRNTIKRNIRAGEETTYTRRARAQERGSRDRANLICCATRRAYRDETSGASFLCEQRISS